MKILIAFVFGFVLSSYVHSSETVEGAKKDFQTFKKDMNKRMDSLETQIKELKTKAKEHGEAAEEKTVTGLENAKNRLSEDLRKLQFESEKNFKKFKTEFASSLDNLNARIQKALKSEE